MKLTEYIEKALEENPDFVPIQGIIMDKTTDGNICGCAMGLAYIGKFGLEQGYKKARSKSSYRDFHAEFGVHPTQVYYINDRESNLLKRKVYLSGVLSVRKQVNSIKRVLNALRKKGW